MENERKETLLLLLSLVIVYIDIMVEEVNKGKMRINVFQLKCGKLYCIYLIEELVVNLT